VLFKFVVHDVFLFIQRFIMVVLLGILLSNSVLAVF